MRALVSALILFAIGASAWGAEPGAELTTSEIYAEFVRNHMRPEPSYYTATAGEEAPQSFRFWVRTEDFGGVDGVRSKTVLRVLAPADASGMTHLVVENDDRTIDEFLYRPSTRRVVRVDACSLGLVGDLRVCDFIPWSPEAAVTRLPDDEIDRVPVYVLDVVGPADLPAPYKRRTVSLEQLRFVPLRIQFWDEDGVEVRRWTARADSIQRWPKRQSRAATPVLRNLASGRETQLTPERRIR